MNLKYILRFFPITLALIMPVIFGYGYITLYVGSKDRSSLITYKIRNSTQID